MDNHQKLTPAEQERQLEALYGPVAAYSEYKRRERVRFRDPKTRQELEGTILWVKSPGPNYLGGPPRPLSYIVDADQGFPKALYQTDIIGRL